MVRGSGYLKIQNLVFWFRTTRRVPGTPGWDRVETYLRRIRYLSTAPSGRPLIR